MKVRRGIDCICDYKYICKYHIKDAWKLVLTAYAIVIGLVIIYGYWVMR